MPHREPSSCELSACAALAGRLPHRVLLAVPDLRHIPTFAQAVEKARAPFEWARLDDLHALSAIVGCDTAERLQQGRYGAYRVIDTRTRLDRQTALYALWCVLAAAGHAEAFERDHPHLGLAALSEQGEATLRETLATEGAESNALFEAQRSQAHALIKLRQHLAVGKGERSASGATPCSR